MKNQIVNVILGTKNKKFTVHIRYFKGEERLSEDHAFSAKEPKKVLECLEEVAKRFKGISNVLTSSSMDFPTEEKVSYKQVTALWKVLED
jgi:hypothetical protein